MRSVGERIRQARTYRGLSGEELARRVGYKHQSAIGNLEARATGTGGNRIVDIARVLDCSVHWLLNGPDTADMASVPTFATHERVEANTARESPSLYRVDRRQFGPPAWPFERIQPHEYAMLSETQRALVEGFVRGLLHDTGTKSNGSAAANG